MSLFQCKADMQTKSAFLLAKLCLPVEYGSSSAVVEISASIVIASVVVVVVVGVISSVWVVSMTSIYCV